SIKESYLKQNATRSVRLMVGFNRRFSPLVQSCHQALLTRNGPCSAVITVNAGAIPNDHWTQDASSGGGRIIGEACHFIDLLRFLCNSEIETVQSNFMRDPLAEGRMPDTATISLSFKNGSIGTVHYFANGNKDFPKERVEIFSNGGILQIDNFKTLTSFGFAGVKNQSLWAQDKGHTNCIGSFIEAIDEGKPAPISFAEIYEVSRATLLAAGLKPDKEQEETDN
ncbi:MAG: Gfo/Idh/MocA family protein, partial [Candidatus Rifleibacteriota bacterium]